MISADNDQVLLLATDMEVGLRVPLAGEIVQPGSAVLPARLLLEVARSLPGERVTLELRAQEQDVELVSGPAKFHLRTLRSEDFPALPAPNPDTRMTLPTKAFVDTALQVSRSASRDETRPVLTGV
jgi:DNA polymerase-3 subunit beta